MKIFGVFRGFPGLGRVVSGIEIMRRFRDEYDCEIILYTYMQGIGIAKDNGFDSVLSNEQIESETITSIGINPVSSLGAKLLMKIIDEKPELVVIDGEPLLIHALSLSFPKEKILSLLNPYDVENPFLPISSTNYFKNCYMSAGTVVVHGLWNIQKPIDYRGDYYSIGTILRNNIINMKSAGNINKDIVCILGGGTKNSSHGFYKSTIEIGSKMIQIAENMPNKIVRIYTNDEKITNDLLKMSSSSNVRIYSNFVKPEEMYSNASMVICRAGRNSTSELLYLGIPAILIATGNDFRAKEQEANIEKICKMSCGQIHKLLYSDNVKKFMDKISILESNSELSNVFEPGNKALLNILKDKMGL